MTQGSPSSTPQPVPYAQRTAKDYIEHINPDIRDTFTETQLSEIHRVLEEAIPKPAPKIVDLRFIVDLIVSRFYVVVLVGKDRRKTPRKYNLPSPVTRIGNFMAAIVLLLSLNLMISAGVAVSGYLIKSAVGIDLFPGHLGDKIPK